MPLVTGHLGLPLQQIRLHIVLRRIPTLPIGLLHLFGREMPLVFMMGLMGIILLGLIRYKLGRQVPILVINGLY